MDTRVGRPRMADASAVSSSIRVTQLRAKADSAFPHGAFRIPRLIIGVTREVVPKCTAAAHDWYSPVI
jgi:hypothetical protein